VKQTTHCEAGFSSPGLPHDVRLALRINDACAALGISRSSLYEMMNAGVIRTAMLAGRRVIPVSELQRVLSQSLGERT
jgi:excisionase family DNA binding protein